jgi:hypothetical protein
LLGLSVEVGLGVLRELLEAGVEEIVGSKGGTIRIVSRSVMATRMGR